MPGPRINRQQIIRIIFKGFLLMLKQILFDIEQFKQCLGYVLPAKQALQKFVSVDVNVIPRYLKTTDACP